MKKVNAESAFMGLIDATPKDPQKGDYYKDGLLYCGKCKTQKQFYLEIAGKNILASCACVCESEAYERREHELRVERLRRNGITDPNYLKWTFAADDQSRPALTAKLHKYVDNWGQVLIENAGLLFTGGVGTGKTFFAACIANALIDKGVPVAMTSFPRLEAGYFEDKTVIDRLNRFDLLVVDDLGVERQSAYMQEIVFSVVDARYRLRKPMIVTTNLSLEELRAPNDDNSQRIYDRIMEMCMPVPFVGKSKREEQKNKKLAVMKKILEG